MASQSKITVCNLALLSIGARAQVSSIDPSDGSTAGDACATLYQFVFEQLARVNRWGCLNKQATLTLIQAAQGTPENPDGTTLPVPQQPWLYAYLYPPDSIFVGEILPSNVTSGSAVNQTSLANSVTPQIPGQYQIPYEISYSTDANNNPIEVILTNQENALASYTVNQNNPSSWDSLFTAAYVASLAAYLAPALSLAGPLMQQAIATAERMIARAKGSDNNETPIVMDNTPDWMRARMGATGTISSGYGYAAYGQMQWPVC